VRGVTPASFTKISNFQQLAVSAKAKAEAKIGPTTTITAASLNGKGRVWGDPLFSIDTGSGESVYTVMCEHNKWYNNLSDGGLQWNAKCSDVNNDQGWVFTSHKLFVGTHVVTFDAAEALAANTGSDKFSDDVVSSPGIPTGAAWPSKITVDGAVFDPTSDIAAGITRKTLLDDPAAGIKIEVQMSLHPVPAEFASPPLPPDHYNFVAIYVTTPHYSLVLSEYDGMAYDDITATNAGMCGASGGIWGKILSGATDTDGTHFEIPGPDAMQTEASWTPTCGGAHLVE
jgi:hypothetical protein